ncbi:MAG: DUF2934 domain-containing protein [Alphaproteobacteria bacterium]|nr:DUF2934 domain-containing protein [Alphaproteobacteria bacterium]
MRAYQIWESEGCPEGRDLDHWYRAETELAVTASPTVVAEDPPSRPSNMRQRRSRKR